MRYFLILFLLVVCAANLWAQDAQLENVTIQAHSLSEQNTANYQVFSRQEIENQFTNLAEFLSQVNGIQINQLSGLGNPAMASMRGASGQQTTVLINGIDSSNAQYGGYDLNQLSISQIEHIEIIQDSFSGSEANQAIGGTINIITRQSHESQLRLQAGSYNTYMANWVQPLGSKFGLQLEHQQSANDYQYPVPSPAFDSQNRYHKEALHNAEFYRHSAQLAGGVEAISGRVQLSKQRKSIEDFQRNHPHNNAYLEQTTGTLELYGNLQLANMQQRWQIGRNQQDESFADKQGKIGLGKDDNRYQYAKNFISLSNQKSLTHWRFDSGVKLYEDSFYSDFKLVANSKTCNNIQTSCDTFSYQQSGQINLAAHWSSESQSQLIHAQLYHQSVKDLSRPRYAARSGDTHHEDFTGGSLAYQFFIADSEWSISYQKAARIPTLYERYGNHGLFKGNSDLLPEESSTYTFNGKWQIFEPFNLSGAVFYRDLTNAMVAIYDARGIGRYENTSSAKLLGLEWTALFKPNNWYAEISGSHYDSESKSRIKSFNNKKLAGTYHQSLIGKTGYKNAQHQWQLRYEISDKLYLDRSNLVMGDRRSLTSANYRYLFSQSELGLAINNLTDNRFKDFTNRPTIGREWSVFFNTRF